MSSLRLLSLDHRQIQREKTLILPDEMRVIFSDALREHGNRGVRRSIHSEPPFWARVYALNLSPARVRKEYSMSNLWTRLAQIIWNYIEPSEHSLTSTRLLVKNLDRGMVEPLTIARAK
jgi:hypothetical protein